MKEWSTKTDDGLIAEANFDPKTSEYEVAVSRGSITKKERFPASFLPSYGIDIEDAELASEIAEKLAQEIEADEKSQ